jgi:hypothetical protein
VQGVRRSRCGPGSVQQALTQHVRRSVVALLAGLEHEHDVPGEPVAMGGQQPRRPDQHRRVQVMTAGVHGVVDLGAEGQVHLLVHRQRIHVASQEDDRAGACTSQHRGHRGQRLARGHLER